MTNKQALAEAQRRWGRLAAIQKDRYKTGLTYTVGNVIMGLALMVKGQGDTWEAAFKNADEKEKKYGRTI